jgi:non-ribosomal peptide synthetase component E (peptide arylation enzyme)
MEHEGYQLPSGSRVAVVIVGRQDSLIVQAFRNHGASRRACNAKVPDQQIEEAIEMPRAAVGKPEKRK